MPMGNTCRGHTYVKSTGQTVIGRHVAGARAGCLPFAAGARRRAGPRGAFPFAFRPCRGRQRWRGGPIPATGNRRQGTCVTLTPHSGRPASWRRRPSTPGAACAAANPCRGGREHASVQSGQSPGQHSRPQRPVAPPRPAPARAGAGGQAAPGCLRYELRQADGDSDLWLLHSEWSDDAAMQAYLAGDAQRVFAEVLWQALAATLDVQERPF